MQLTPHKVKYDDLIATCRHDEPTACVVAESGQRYHGRSTRKHTPGCRRVHRTSLINLGVIMMQPVITCLLIDQLYTYNGVKQSLQQQNRLRPDQPIGPRIKAQSLARQLENPIEPRGRLYTTRSAQTSRRRPRRGVWASPVPFFSFSLFFVVFSKYEHY
jgi:hypothetical protein